MSMQKNWVGDSTCNEVGLVEDFKEKEEKAEVLEFPDDESEKLDSFYKDDLVIVTMNYNPGKFTVQDIVLAEEVIQKSF